MPIRDTASIRVSALSWVPPLAYGLVRDLRARWALEEAGRAYCVRLHDPREALPESYLAEQPFGQVPSYRDNMVEIFESGAIVLHIASDCEALLPTDAKLRARGISWLFAALNSVEPHVHQLSWIKLFHADAPWAAACRAEITTMLEKRLSAVERCLGDKEWLEGGFTAGDLMMVSVLRNLRSTGIVSARPKLAAYVARGEARPAFERALADQMAPFEANT